MTGLIFALFLALLLACLVMGWPVAWAMAGGVVLFAVLGLHMGAAPRALWRMAWEKGRTAGIVLRILLLIGAITGLWRASGTIAYCVYYGIRLITPNLFLLLAFFLTAVMSYALGTSFGVASTAGIIFMALARSGGVDVSMAAGAILSGVYFGDRCSPASSSANLVAAVTGTSLYRNVPRMFLTALPATGLTVLVYLVLSLGNPIAGMDSAISAALEEQFVLTWPALVPVVVILVLPLCRVPIAWALTASAAASAAVGLLSQHLSPGELLAIALFGYQPTQEALSAVMAGGGVVSMLSTCLVVLCTGMYSGILEGIGALGPLEGKLGKGVERFGRLPVALGTALASISIFCNQSVAIILTEQLRRRFYSSREELAQDIENTAITLAAVVPWSISCTVPLATMGAGYGAVPYAVLLWLIPVCYLPTKRWFYPDNRKK